MIDELALPSGERVQFIFLRKWPNLGNMIYLQSIRSGLIEEDSSVAQDYRAQAPFYASQLATAVPFPWVEAFAYVLRLIGDLATKPVETPPSPSRLRPVRAEVRSR